MSSYRVSFTVRDQKKDVVLAASLFQGKVDKKDEDRIEAAFASVKLPGCQNGTMKARLTINKNGRNIKNPTVRMGLAEAVKAEKTMLAAAGKILKGTAKAHGIK